MLVRLLPMATSGRLFGEAMDIFKTRLFFEGHDEGHSFLVETISISGQWWLVSSWLVSNTTGERVPERLVRLSGLRFEEVNEPKYRFLLNNSIPKSVFDGKAQEGYVIATYQALSQSQELPTKAH